MPRRPKPKLQQVNALFLKEDIDFIKDLAKKELSLTWHPLLRQVLHAGVKSFGKRRVIK